MAREEQDREDLLKEAVALVERVELTLSVWPEHVVAGFRRDGCTSLYFGSDPAYHFNTSRQLRRAYVDGLLYKAEYGRLVSMQRQRSDNEVQLIRHDLDEAATCEFLATLVSHASQLFAALESGDYKVIGQTPPEADIVGHVRLWLLEIGENVQIAASPRVG